MNTFNRLFVILVGLATIGAAVLIVLLALEAIEPSSVGAGWLKDQWAAIDRLTGWSEVITVAASIGAGLLAALLLALEFATPWRARAAMAPPKFEERGEAGRRAA